MVERTTSQARRAFSETVDRAMKGERTVLTRHNRAVAAIVPVEDLELLRELEARVEGRKKKGGKR